MLQIRSLVTGIPGEGGRLRISLDEVATPSPGPSDVLVRVEATPINPSDNGLLLASAAVAEAVVEGAALCAPISAAALAGMTARLDQPMPVGNEACGVVVGAGESAAAQALIGKTVAVLGGAMYAQYRVVPAAACLLLPDGTEPADGASCFVNPLTALGMVETMQREGHTALVHTAAASNLGQMLNRICMKDGVELVNIVRRPEQAELLRSQGATHVCDSSLPSFRDDLTQALIVTGATIAFDATGGGSLASQILASMETALNAGAAQYNRYGSTTHKQVYLYGNLDRGPTQLDRTFGMAWGVGGWLLTYFMAQIGQDGADRLRARVVDELTTTFASHYTDEISLAEILDPAVAQSYAKHATGQKFLIRPQR
ncbi:MAG: zinc-binding dehydrogenase [Actinomycetota bacterium]|nr:zinc-binding dehydrogenase [Actinomycetota bacterium]